MTNEKGATSGSNGWSVDETGLPVYAFSGIDAAVAEWRAQAGEEADARLRQGAVALEVRRQRKYGEGNLAAFAKKINRSTGTARDYARVYEHLASLEKSERSLILGWLARGEKSHSQLLRASVIDDPAEFLRVIKETKTVDEARDAAKPIVNRQNVEKVEKAEEEAIIEARAAAPAQPPSPSGSTPNAPSAPRVAASPVPAAVSAPRDAAQPSASVAAGAVARADSTAAVPATVPAIRLGVHLGDCAQLSKLLAPKSASAIICDPPYGTRDTGGRGQGSQGPIDNDENPRVAAKAVREMLEAVEHTLADDAPALFFCSPKSKITAIMMRVIARSGYLKVSPIPLIWHKGVGRWCQQSEGARRTYEAIIYAQKGTPRNKPSEGGDVLSCRPLPSLKRLHHHEKPLGLMARLVRDYVPEGGLVLDPFCGSGSTLRAAELLGRRAVGFEIKAEFYARAERQLDRVRRAPVDLRRHWLEQALQRVSAEPRGLSAEPGRIDAAVFDALPESTRARVQPLFDDLDSLFYDAPPPPPGSVYGALSEVLRQIDRLGAA